MKYLLVSLLFLAGCANSSDPVSTAQTNNSQIKVELLFQHEKCKVYRFADAGRYIYYTDCKGTTAYSESCGKNYVRPNGVSGGK